jgi:hypothetical protein
MVSSMRTKWTCLLTVAAMAMSCTQLGCSFLLVKGPPSPDEPVRYSEEGGFACTEVNVAPKADIVLAAIGGGINFLALGTATGTPPANQTAQQQQDSQTRFVTMFWSGLAIAGLGTVSALWGFHTTRKCREYVESPWTRRALRRQREAAMQAEAAGEQPQP